MSQSSYLQNLWSTW